MSELKRAVVRQLKKQAGKSMFTSLGRMFSQKGGNSAMGKGALGSIKKVKPVSTKISHSTF